MSMFWFQEKKQKEHLNTYTVQFNREKTTRTTSTSPPIITPPSSIHSANTTSLKSFQEASRSDIPSTRLSTHFSLGGTGDSKVGGTGRSSQGGGGGGGVRVAGGAQDSSGGGGNNKMGGKERIQKTSANNTFSNMSTVGGTLGSPTTLAPGRDGPLNSNSSGANNIRSTSSSSKPCCFCWCCCCSCSW